MDTSNLSTKLLGYLNSQCNNRVNLTIKDLNEINLGWETELFTFQLYFTEKNINLKEDLVLRVFSGENAASKASKEYYLMKRLHKIEYPVPPVHNLETSGNYIGKPFIIMKRIIGKPLDSTFKNETEETLREGVSRLIRLFVRLHSLDISEFRDLPYFSLSDSIQNYIDYYESTRDDHAPWMAPIINWITENWPSDTLEYQSLCHMDYHGMNVMIDENDHPYVIDWGASRIGDSRLDLAWTILLYSTFGGSMFRAPLIEFYKNQGGKTGQLEFFEVMAATRRITDLIRTTIDSESVGLKPELLQLMRDSKDHFIKVHSLLEERTGIRLNELDKLLDSY